MPDDSTFGPERLQASCCIAGGGPAGMMLGLLLARAGVDVRRPREARRLPARLPRRHDPPVDARGDARARAPRRVPASCPHQEAPQLTGVVRRRGGPDRRLLPPADALPVHRLHAAVGLPRLPRRARAGAIPRSACGCAPRSPTSSRRTAASSGVRATTADGPLEVRADLDRRRGRARTRRSATRAGLAVEDLGAPMDVLWLRLSRQPDDPRAALGPLRPGPDLRDDQPRRLLAVRLRHPQGRRRRDPCGGASTRSAAEIAATRAVPARPRRRAARLGRRQAADRRGRSPPRWYAPACSASATRRTRCRRSAASASTSRSRTPSRRQTS